MASPRRSELTEIANILVRHGPVPKEVSPAIRRLLRRGAGEEAIVERLQGALALGEEDLLSMVRDLLRLGIRPAGDFRRHRAGPDVCSICGKEVPFCWGCSCGFRICQACLEENRWGITCNNITWECPDCGAMRSF